MQSKIFSYLTIIAGGVLTAAAFGLLVLPQNFVAGGVTGLALILSPLLKLPVPGLVLGINLLLFALGWIFVGREFVFKTLIMTFLFPVLLDFFGSLSLFSALSSDPLLSSLIAGCFLGAGSGLILRANGSGGGFDILGVVLHKKWRIPVSAVMYTCDFAVILCQILINPLLSTMYGIVVILCSSIVVNKIITHGESKVQLLIFSKDRETIRSRLLGALDTGVTLLHGETGYRGDQTQIILTILPYSKVNAVKKMVYEVDPYAFTVINPVNYVGGRGYSIRR